MPVNQVYLRRAAQLFGPTDTNAIVNGFAQNSLLATDEIASSTLGPWVRLSTIVVGGQITHQGIVKALGAVAQSPIQTQPASNAWQSGIATKAASTNKSPGSERSGGNVANVIVPYKNPCALISYYLGVASLPCFWTGILPFLALLLGVIGVIYRIKNPEARGLLHAIIGILIGGLFTAAIVGLAIYGMIDPDGFQNTFDVNL